MVQNFQNKLGRITLAEWEKAYGIRQQTYERFIGFTWNEFSEEFAQIDNAMRLFLALDKLPMGEPYYDTETRITGYIMMILCAEAEGTAI